MARQEISPTSKLQIIPAGNAPYPGNCACCGSVERDVIDFGLTVDYFGGVFICTECFSAAIPLVDLGQTLAVPLPHQFDTVAIYESLNDLNSAARRLISLIPDDDLGDDPLLEDTEGESTDDSGTNSEPEFDEPKSQQPSDPLFQSFGL